MQDMPRTLERLLYDHGGDAVEFRKNIRRYDCALQLASSVSKKHPLLERMLQQRSSTGPQSYVVGGHVYHRMGPLLPDDGRDPQFAQLFCYDPDHELENRMKVLQDMNPTTLRDLQGMLHEHNHWVRQLRNVANMDGDEWQIHIAEDVKAGIDTRRYNAPESLQVSILMGRSDDDNQPQKRDFVIRKRSDPELADEPWKTV